MGSGHCIENKKGKLLDFEKQRHYFYWCLPYEKMLLDHFPASEEWIKHMTYINAKEDYKNQPCYTTLATPYFTVISPKSGIINAKVGDIIHFELEVKNYAGPFIMQTTTNLKPEKYSKTEFKRKGTIICFDYPVENKKIREIIIYSDSFEILAFKVKVE